MLKKDATALHVASDSGDHLVGIGDLRVILIEEGPSWYAQGLEIDYVAQGSSIEDAKANFETGLHATVRENLRMFGTIESLLMPAPMEVWKDRLNPHAKARRFYYTSLHQIGAMDDVVDFLPFQGIDYLRAEGHG